jgi:hypothetical protein
MRQYQIKFGKARDFVETVDQPVVESAGRQFLEGIRYDGMGKIEFKFDGKFKSHPRQSRRDRFRLFVVTTKSRSEGLKVTPVSTHRRAAWVREITLRSRNLFREIKILSAWISGKFTLSTFSFFDPAPFFAELVLWAIPAPRASRQRKAK